VTVTYLPIESNTSSARAGGTGGTGGTARYWMWVWLGAFGSYTLLALISVAQSSFFMMHHGEPVVWPDLITDRFLDEFTCVLFVPPLFWLVRRFPIDRQQWRRNVSILLAASISFVVLKYALFFPIDRLFWHGETESFLAAFATHSFAVLLDYWAVICVAHALEFYRRAQERERTASQLRVQLSRAQLDALQAQLHPHFLFNTLNGAATLMHRDVEGADQMLTNLADLLRVTLRHTGSDEIPLADELELLDRYLGIVRIRFRDRLTVTCEITPETRDALVPHFLLQPLVENALEHGIAQRPGPGVLEIRACRVGDRLRITVVDDGPGLRSHVSSGNGVGLANTRARLAQLYGAAQDLTLEPVSPTCGARATVTLPYRAAAARGDRASLARALPAVEQVCGIQ
jgi:two-component system LytT family sensor kinase